MPIVLESTSDRFKVLHEDEDLPEALSAFDLTPQRTPNWWKRRSGRLSGSKLSQFMFINDPEELNTFRDEVFGLRPRPPLDEDAMKRVRFGVDNEPNAAATLLYHMKDIRLWDIGFEIHPRHKWFGSSPDGVVYWPELGHKSGAWGALEIKCCTKTNAKGESIPHAGVPYYYIPQLHAEMTCMPTPFPVRFTVFVTWSLTKTKIYLVEFDDAYWSILWDTMVNFVIGDMPYAHWQEQQLILKRASETVAKNAKLLCVVDSCTVAAESEA